MQHDQGWDGVGRYGMCGSSQAFGRIRSVVFEIGALVLTRGLSEELPSVHCRSMPSVLHAGKDNVSVSEP